ncbi:alpha/beta hydrolase [Phenylobacterium sp.]|uniref:alpha/beta hydrolase n=1 Tax=Phenylobacterium sp. TaxID=1871053 RepID=UPI00122906CB|nr:alpha/beta hydrolase [Phenylobacterium sp.]THD59712.1 MAG: alpha/beta hydrolase [Phenylobacterium sp.]
MLRWVMVLGVVMSTTMAFAGPAPISAYQSQPRHRPDAEVRYGPAPAQVAELYLPKSKLSPHPVVVLLHGGCFLKEYEGFAQVSAIAADLAARGYAVWNLEYRKLGEAGAGYPGTFQDVATGIDRLRAEAPKYGLDLGRVIAVGHSAGGHLALWAAARGRLPASSPLHTADPVKIRAVISLAGIGDLQGQGRAFALPCGDDTIDRLVDTAHRNQPFADTSPAELLPTGAKVVMVHGVYDAVMPPYTGLDYAEKVRRAGDHADVVTIPDAGHFDLVIPTTAAWGEVAAVLDREMKALSP